MTPQQFLLFAKVLPEPLCLVSGEGTILACNPALTTLVGMSNEALSATLLWELTTDSAEKVKQYLRACSGSNQLMIGALTLRVSHGEAQPYRCEGALLQPRTGDSPSLLLLRFMPKDAASGRFLLLNEKINQLSTEIRERRRAEEEAQSQRQQLHVTLSSIGDAVIATDAQGNVTFMNPVAEAMTGWSQPEAAGRPLNEIFHIVNEETRQIVASPVAEVLRKGAIVGLANHTVLLARDGTECPIDDSGAPIRNDEGQIIGVILVFRDVSERKRAEDALYREKLFTDMAVDSLPGIFYLISDQGQFLRWNKHLEQVTGYSSDEIAAMHPLAFFRPADQPLIAARIQQVFVEGESVAEAPLLAKDGTAVPYYFTGKLIDLNHAPCLVGMGINIADRVQAEQEREELLVREQTARSEAEALAQRTGFLARAGELLASSLEYETTLKQVARLVIPQYADWCAIDVLATDGTMQRLTTVHQDAGQIAFAEEMRRRYPLDQDVSNGLAMALQTGQSQLYPEITAERLAQVARDDEHRAMLLALGIKSVMIIPLVARGQILGAITFVIGESDRRYSETDLVFAQDLARRAALAVDNARLYREAQAALTLREQALELHRNVDQRLSTLIEAANTLLGAKPLEEVQQAILDLSARLIAADAYAVWRRERQQPLWQVATAINLSKTFQEAVIDAREAESPQLESPLAVESVKAVTWLRHRQEAYEREGIVSFLSLPLMVHGEFAGAINFYYRTPHQFTELEIRVAAALANLAAAAISSAELYQEQSQLRVKAEEASRLKDEFLATVSHELRTPLNAILGWITLLRGGKLDAATATRAMATIEKNARSQNALIADILDVSRIITGRLRLNPELMDVAPVIEATLDSVRPTAEAKGVHLVSRLSPQAGFISGDRERIQQIVWNLLSNAIKFTPKNGQVEATLLRLGAQLELIVSDTGIGIPQEFLPFVFDRFRQADSSSTRLFGGLGLGLSIVRHLVELHGGTVSVNSTGEGKGATFKVVLPVAISREEFIPRNSSSAAEARELPTLSQDLQGLRILVVDDDDATRDLLTVILSQSGASVQAVDSAAKALRALNAWNPNVLVSDIGMPLEDGYALIRQVRARSPQEGGTIPALALTAYAKSEDRLRALAAGYQMHLDKPVDPIELTAVIASLVRR